MSKWSIHKKVATLLAVLATTSAMAATDSRHPTSVERSVVAGRATTRMVVFAPTRYKDSIKLIEQTVSVSAGVEPRVAAIGYLARPGGVLPIGTRVRGLYLEDGVLHIDFSQELKRFSGGSSAEGLLVAALSATVARFDGVKAFQLSVMNQPLTELGGHIDFSEPYPATKILPEEFH